jgi:cobalt-zinc-cadmium efflux system outer membrane protein
MSRCPRPGKVLVAVIALAAVGLTGCAAHVTTTPDDVASAVRGRTGAAPRVAGDEAEGGAGGGASGSASDRPAPGAIRFELPAKTSLDDGVTADEAVAIALWNNAAFQVSVSQLGFARADLQDAGMLTNPVFSLLFPVGPKQLEATLRWPVEVLWERPKRVAGARLAADAAGQRLVQTGLDLVVSVRTAHADLELARERVQLAGDAAQLLTRIDTLTQSRLNAGDIGTLDARAATVEAARARQDHERTGHDVTIAQARLANLLGLPIDREPTLTVSSSSGPLASCDGASLKDALAARPDIRAAELTVEAAAARLGWERARILTFSAVLDANGEGRDGFEMGPGIDVSLPIFNRNQGGRTRAQAELRRAAAAYVAIQQQVAQELREARAQFAQAKQSSEAWQTTILQPLQANVAGAEQAFKEGEVSYLFVLENTRRLIEARLRTRELAADERRAHARIERAIGRSCSAPLPQESLNADRK